MGHSRGLYLGAGVAFLLAVGCQANQPELTDHAVDEERLLPAGVRRLSSHEYDRAASALVGFEVTPSERWGSDALQHGFSINSNQVVDPVLQGVLYDGALEIAAQAVSERRSVLMPCAEPPDAACVLDTLRELGHRAFRRPLTQAEIERYQAVYEAGSQEGGMAGGLELVLTALLQSPHLLYVTALGSASSGTRVVSLTAHEQASLLAFSVAGTAPDDMLLEAAAAGRLARPEGRKEAARRLLAESATRHHYRRFVDEWLGMAALSLRPKDRELYPTFEQEVPAVRAHTHEFVDFVMAERNASLGALLVGAESAEPERPGILQQRAFLATHAHEADSGPVLRGIAVLERILCRELPDPVELGIEIVPPPPDPNATTRRRFEQHTSDPICAGCHDPIDAIGFTFENFDAVGLWRDTEAGQPLETGGALDLENGSVPLANSADLSRTLAASPEAERCLARQVFRFVTGASQPQAEDAFVDLARSLPAPSRRSVVELVVHWVGSDSFALRTTNDAE